MNSCEERPTAPLYMVLINYLSHAILIFYGYLNEFLISINGLKSYEVKEVNRDSYTPLYDKFSTFYYRHIIRRMSNMWEHPICSVPGSRIDILERKFNAYNIKWKFTGRKISAINMGSYNYLGYAQNNGPINESVETTIEQLGVGIASTPNEIGTQEICRNLERLVADFLGVEDSIVIGMGFATNSNCIPALFGRGCLVISDEHNHASLILGCRLSGAKVKVFKHNNMEDLELIVRQSIIEGQPKTGRDWKKIIIMVEGIYSMEGTIVNLPEVLRIKKKFKTYLYLDEAHSIGALGPHGRGVCDYYSCDPKEVDLLMGTFTKSFAAAGGYISGSKKTISYIRYKSASFYYATSISPPIAQQIISVITALMDTDGLQRIKRLHENTKYFRQQLVKSGFHIDGNNDSPVIPIMVYSPANLKCFISELLDRGIATTGVSFPVTSLIGVKARLCLSAAHTQQMIDYTIDSINEVGNRVLLKYSNK